MSKASTMAGFVAGLVIGGAAAWYYAREMYSRIAEEEINSVKEAYARQKEQAEERPRTQAAVSPNKPDEKMDIRQYAQKASKKAIRTIPIPWLIKSRPSRLARRPM